jgi:hypothetical protein
MRRSRIHGTLWLQRIGLSHRSHHPRCGTQSKAQRCADRDTNSWWHCARFNHFLRKTPTASKQTSQYRKSKSFWMASFRQTFSSKSLAPVFSIAAAAAFVKYPPSDRSLTDGKRPQHLLCCWYHPRRFTNHHQQYGVASCDAAAAAPKRSMDAPKQEQYHSGLDNGENKPEVVTVPVVPSDDGFQANAVGTFHGMFPARQLFQPAMPYPLWNSNWDGRQPKVTDDPQADKQRMRTIRKNGTTRHIILIRHGECRNS